MSLGNESLKTVNIDGTKVEVVGCWDENTPEGKFDYYDFFVNGVCINLGEPCYEKPTRKVIGAYLEIWKEMS